MTDEQRERIRAAARELADAMTAAGNLFEVNAVPTNTTPMQSKSERWAYEVFVKVTTEEVIA